MGQNVPVAGLARVADYLQKSGLQKSLDALGFHVTGFGCMTCVGFSGPLAAPVSAAIADSDVAAAAVLSGNRNYEGRVHPQVRASFLASPPLVVAYALAGTILKDLTHEPLGVDPEGRAVYCASCGRTRAKFARPWITAIEPALYTLSYAHLYDGSAEWQALPHQRGTHFEWNAASTVIRRPSLFDDVTLQPAPLADIRSARVLAIFGDLVTTEHVSPMGTIPTDRIRHVCGRARRRARRFRELRGARLNHDVMIRGTLASAHLKNEMMPGRPGGFTLHMPGREPMSIYEAAQLYRQDAVPLVIVAGSGYGTGSSRDWSAKGVCLLGVRAVIAESFERIHRANLVAAGVLPLQFAPGHTRRTLSLDGSEVLDITGLAAALEPMKTVSCYVTRADGRRDECLLVARLETTQEVEYFRHGGILNYVLRRNCQPLSP